MNSCAFWNRYRGTSKNFPARAFGLGVTSRVIVGALTEQVWPLALPVLEGGDGRSGLQFRLRKLAVVKVDVALDRLLQVFAAVEAVALQDIFDPAVEPLDHAVCLRPHRRGQAMLDAKLGVEQVELVLTGGAALAQAEQPVGEGLSVVGQHASDLHRGGTFEIAEEPACVGRGLCRVDAHEDPPRRAVDGHEEIASRGFVCHLGQILDVDVQIAGLVGLEGAVCRLRLLRLQRLQVAHPMTAQAAVEARARGTRVEELAHHGQQIIKRQEKRLAQRNCDGFLRRGQRRLQLVWRMAPVVNVVATPPLPDRLLGDPIALGHLQRRLRARLNSSADLRRRRRLLVQRDQHPSTPSQTSRRIDLAMNRAVRRGSM